jgi:hypothetical protein
MNNNTLIKKINGKWECVYHVYKNNTASKYSKSKFFILVYNVGDKKPSEQIDFSSEQSLNKFIMGA